jgi:hypothetical protein
MSTAREYYKHVTDAPRTLKSGHSLIDNELALPTAKQLSGVGHLPDYDSPFNPSQLEIISGQGTARQGFPDPQSHQFVDVVQGVKMADSP